MNIFIICLAAFLTSGLTLFSGFGLGTLLMPVFALFFPVNLAVALTAVVHFLNNLFKLALLGKFADRKVVLAFGLPAILAAFLGAQLLNVLSHFQPLVHYELFGREASVTPIKLVMAALMILFAAVESIPPGGRRAGLNLPYGEGGEKRAREKSLALGGLLSGFFGGLSGHQGAFRSAFLLKCGLSKESFLGTGILIACLIDLSRMSVYFPQFFSKEIRDELLLLILAALSAFLGAWFGNLLVKKVTIRSLQTAVSALLVLISLGLALGLI